MDLALQRAFRRGDHDALEAVYRQYVGDVERFVRRTLGRMGRFAPSDLADIVQDVFVKAFARAARESYDGERAYGPFLLTITRNVVIDWARRSGREIPGSDALAGTLEQAAAGEPEESPPFAAALVAATNAYVEKLPEDLRGVHRQRFVLGLPQRQAADALGISRQTLRTLEKKLVVGLRKELRRAGLAAELADTKFSNPKAAIGRKDQARTDATGR